MRRVHHRLPALTFSAPLLVIFFVGLLGAESSIAGEVRVLGNDKETSTSKCLGDPKTPLCAAETALAW